MSAASTPERSFREVLKKFIALLDTFSTSRKLATVYFFCSLILVSCLALIVPPFHNSDEFAHFHRVDQISHGGLLVHRTGSPSSAGGIVNIGPLRLTAVYEAIRFHTDVKVTPEMTRQTAAISMGVRTYVPFSNSAVYSPLLYVPCVGGFVTSRLLHLNAAQPLHLTRLFNGITCVFLAALAIALAGQAAPFLTAVLSLPMTWSLFAAVSQDGLMMVAAAFGGCLFIGRARTFLQPGWSGPLLWSAAALGALAVGRPVYLPLILLPFLAVSFKNRQKAAIACGTAFGGVVLWCLLAQCFSAVPMWAHASPRAQLSNLLHHPFQIGTLVFAALGPHQGMTGFPFWKEMIGLLGWIDTPMPQWFYPLCAGVMGTLLVTIRPEGTLWAPWKRLAAAILIGGCITLIFFLEYLTFTPVGQPFVVGVQGRYFLPLLPFLPLLAMQQRALVPETLSKHLNAMVPAFLVLSGIVCLYSVFTRYYIQGSV